MTLKPQMLTLDTKMLTHYDINNPNFDLENQNVNT